MTLLGRYGHLIALGPDNEGKIKRPVGQDWQHHGSTPEELARAQGVGFAPGPNVYVLDFDGQKDTHGSKFTDSSRLTAEFKEKLADDKLYDRLLNGYAELSLSHGWHIVYMVNGYHTVPSKKLAYHPDGKTAVEVLSSGMQMAIGKPISNNAPAMVLPEEHDRIIASLKSMNRAPSTTLVAGGSFTAWMGACKYGTYDEIPDMSMGSDDELAALVASMVSYGSPYEYIRDTWYRVAVTMDTSWPWTDDDFQRHYQGAENKFGLQGQAKAQEREEVGTWMEKLRTTGSPVSSIWSQERLAHIRQAAYAHMVSPEAVLLCCLARVAAMRPAGLDALTFRPLSLNWYTAIPGNSSSGKTTAEMCAKALLPPSSARRTGFAQPHLVLPDEHGNPPFREASASTGEGLIDMFRGMISQRTPHLDENGKDKGGRSAKIPAQVRENALLTTDEGKAFLELGSRQGATLLAVFNTAWSGGDLSTALALGNSRDVNKYCIGAIVGFQPVLMAPLLATGDLGTAQRFGYASPVDPSIPRDRPQFPGALEVVYPRVVESMDGGKTEMTFEPAIIEEVTERRYQMATGKLTPDPLNGKHDELRLRCAALLHLLCQLDGLVVGQWCWEAAGLIVNRSNQVRDLIAAEYTTTERNREAQDIEAIKAKLVAYVIGGGTKLKAQLSKKQRDMVADQWDELRQSVMEEAAAASG